MKTFPLPLILLSAALLIAGCATKPGTGDANPSKIKIHQTDIGTVKTQLVAFMTNGDFQVTLESQEGTTDRLVFAKPVSGTSGLFDHLVAGSANTQEATYDFELSQKRSNVIVTAGAALTTRNPAGETGHENMDRKWATDIEHALLNVRAVVEGQPHQAELQKIYEKNKGRIGVAFDGAGYIMQLTPNGPGATAGLKPGDRIIAVNHWPFSADIDDKIEQITGKPGSSVRITVLRDGQKMSFKVVRQ